MKILFQYYYGGGGALENFLNLLNAMIEDKSSSDEFLIICHRESKLNILSKHKNVKVVNPYPYFHKELARLFLGLFGLKKIANKFKPDVVWSLNLGSYSSLQFFNVLSLNNAHQVYPFKETNSHPGNKFRVFLLRFFFRISLSKSNLVLTQTGTMANYVKNIRSDVDVRIVPKVVEINSGDGILSDDIFQLVSKAFLKKMLYIATDYNHKNHVILFKLLERLRKENIKVTLILTITAESAISIGGDNINTLIKEGYLICLGWVDKSELKPLYDIVDMCVMPSKLESLSSSYLEALSWHKPQVVSDVPFAKETCGDAAIYADPDSVDDWYKATLDLLNNKERVDHLLSLAPEQLKKFPSSWEEMARNTKRAFRGEV